MSFFSADIISAGYNGKQVLSGACLEFEPGQVFGIVGPNGSGKSTFLKAVCNVLPHSGNCSIEGNVLESLNSRERARLCSYVPQGSGISIDISVLDAVLLGFNPDIPLWGKPSEAMRQRAVEALKSLGLIEKQNQNYLTLSEGQKQLCMLARVFATDRQLLFLDEPESSLDIHWRYRVMDIVKAWTANGRKGTVIALHDLQLALNYCDKIMLISDGKTAGYILPGKDTLKSIEEKLGQLYGPIIVHSDQCGQYVVLKEKGGV